MGDDAKYIIYKYAVYIFPNFVEHAAFARNMGFTYEEIQSAGFIGFSDKGPYPYGKSVSLKIESNCDSDMRIIKKTLNIYDPEDDACLLSTL